MSAHAPLPFEGSLMADGMVVERRLAGAAFDARLHAALRRRDRIFRLGDDVLVLFEAPRRLRTDRMGGAPVVRREGSLLTFDGDPSALPTRTDPSLYRLEWGRVTVTALAGLEEIRPADVVDPGAIRLHAAEPLGAPPPQPACTPDPEPPPLRELFGIEASEDQARFVDSLAERERGELGRKVAARLRAFVDSIRHGRGRTTGSVGHALASRRPSVLDHLLERISRALLLLERLTGRQAKYLNDLVRRFEKGDVEAALRRAIPLGGSDPEALTRVALGVPSPRANLRIDPHRPAAGRTMLLSAGAQQTLRESYEEAFRKLSSMGRHRDAAFVLAELLNAHDRAVDYLESHGEVELAAQIAEARALPADRIVALWYQAGDRTRAIAVARRTGAFMAAIARLERARRPEATALRLEYADLLASAGDFVRAVEVAWPVREGRTLARAWLGRAIEVGGLTAARGWARRLFLEPPDLDDVRARLLPALADPSLEGAYWRETFVSTVLSDAMTPVAWQALKLCYRRMLRDRLEHGRPTDKLVRKVEEELGDAVLLADAPPLSPRPPREMASQALVLGPLDAGTVPVRDAVALPDGRVLVALGEHGVRLIGKRGQTEVDFLQPADGLIVDDAGERVITLVGRAATVQLGRIDLRSRRAEPWFQLRFDVAAGTFDGECLYVASHEGEEATLLCLDALASSPTVLHSVSGLPGTVQRLARSRTRLRLLLVAPASNEASSLGPYDLEYLQFELPSRILRHREVTGLERTLTFANDCYPASPPGPRQIGLSPDVSSHLGIEDDEHGVRIELVNDASGTSEPHPLLFLEGATCARGRVHGERITLSDDRGRIVVFETTTLAHLRTIFV